MTMPRSFRLGIHRIKVTRPRGLEEEHDASWKTRRACPTEPSYKQRVVGVFRYSERRLSVLRELKGTAAQAVFAHELGHAVWRDAGLDDHFSDRTEEIVVEAFTKAWLEVQRRNRLVNEYLMSEEDP